MFFFCCFVEKGTIYGLSFEIYYVLGLTTKFTNYILNKLITILQGEMIFVTRN